MNSLNLPKTTLNIELTPIQAIVLWRLANELGCAPTRDEFKETEFYAAATHKDYDYDIRPGFDSVFASPHPLWEKLDNALRHVGIDPSTGAVDREHVPSSNTSVNQIKLAAAIEFLQSLKTPAA